MKVQLHPDAERELSRAADWYDEQRLGLGNEILAEIRDLLTLISERPAMWPMWPGAPDTQPPIRRALAAKFPFAIAYQAHPDRIWVLAFAHTSRRPFFWAERAVP